MRQSVCDAQLQDSLSQRATVMICDILVNTHSHTNKQLLYNSYTTQLS